MDDQAIHEEALAGMCNPQELAERWEKKFEANRKERAPIWDDTYKASLSDFSEGLSEDRKIITSVETIIVPTDREQDWTHDGCGKPLGLWYSCGGSWIDWCVSEDFGCPHLIHEVQLYNGKVCKITNDAEFVEFSDEFGMKSADYYAQKMGVAPDSEAARSLGILDQGFGEMRPNYINWHDVSEIWSGIEISPYLWSLRLNGGMWYYGWDCAAGCIWDAGAIRSIELIATYNEHTKRMEYLNEDSPS